MGKCVNTKQLLLNIKNNTGAEMPIDILQNAYLNGFLNSTTKYQWDVTSQNYTYSASVSIQVKVAGNDYQTFTALLSSKDPDGVIAALNTLNIGIFYKDQQSGQILIVTDNDNFVYGNLDIINAPPIGAALFHHFLTFYRVGSSSSISHTFANAPSLITSSFVPQDGNQYRLILRNSNTSTQLLAATSSYTNIVGSSWKLLSARWDFITSNWVAYNSVVLQYSQDVGVTWIDYVVQAYDPSQTRPSCANVVSGLFDVLAQLCPGPTKVGTTITNPMGVLFLTQTGNFSLLNSVIDAAANPALIFTSVSAFPTTIASIISTTTINAIAPFDLSSIFSWTYDDSTIGPNATVSVYTGLSILFKLTSDIFDYRLSLQHIFGAAGLVVGMVPTKNFN